MARPSKNEKLSPLTNGLGSNVKFADILSKKSNSYALRNLRKSKGYTLADIASLTGLSPSYISKLEAGDRRYNSDVLAKLATVLGCNESDLLKKNDDGMPPAVKEATYVPQKDLPVYKMIAGSVLPGGKANDFAVCDFEAPVTRIFRLPQLLGIKSAFAFNIVDSLNSPKYRKGDMIFVHTERPIARGCPVALITLANQIVVGELIDWDDEQVFIKHFSQENNIVISKKELQATYSILCSFDYYQGA
jgi:transcriptional regulator with XRE-family HTH domain